jgi:hypothetical protein
MLIDYVGFTVSERRMREQFEYRPAPAPPRRRRTSRLGLATIRCSAAGLCVRQPIDLNPAVQVDQSAFQQDHERCAMVSLGTIRREAPEFAARVKERFEAGTNKTMATLRTDGSPRISAIELEFGDDEITLGMAGGSMKLRDVRRDPRVAIHAPTIEPPKPAGSDWAGDAKLAGRVVEIDQPADVTHPGAGYFHVDVDELVLTHLGGEPAEHLVVESWRPGHGLRQHRRYG